MKPLVVVLSLIISLTVVFSAPTKTDTRFKLTEEVGASSNSEIQTLITNLANSLASFQGLAPFARPLIGWNLPTGVPANGFPGQQGGVTLQPGAFHRPALLNGVLPARDGQRG